MARFKDLTGEKFGKLKVLELAEDHVSSNGKKTKQWLCKCECGNNVVVKANYLKSGKKTSCGCTRNYTSEKSEEWYKLCKYIEENVMGYRSGEKTLDKTMCLKLKGLCTGKNIANNKIADTAHYDYNTILATYMFCSQEIQRIIMTVDFNDDHHRFNYILRVVENNLNTVQTRIENIKMAEEKTKSLNLDHLSYKGAEYKRKTKEAPKGLEYLW